MSTDGGWSWLTIGTETTSLYLTPTLVGIGVNAQANVSGQQLLVSLHNASIA
jgi:hypothetical protein